MRGCTLWLLLAAAITVSGCKMTDGDSAADHEDNQKIGANAD